jgi:hypothetical protein
MTSAKTTQDAGVAPPAEGGTTPTADELKAAYARGYYAGRRRKKQEISREVRRHRENAQWHRYMQAALMACITSQGWKVGDRPIINVPDRTKLAADFADEALKLALQRCRL